MTKEMLEAKIATFICCFLSGTICYWIGYFLGKKEAKEK